MEGNKFVYTQVPDEEVSEYPILEDELDETGIVFYGNGDFKTMGDYETLKIVHDYDRDYETELDLVDYLSDKTGKKYNQESIRGYVQGDYQDVYYPEDTDKNFVKYLSDMYMGKYDEFVCEDECSVYVPHDVSWEGKDAIRKYISEETGEPEDSIIVKLFKGWQKQAIYEGKVFSKRLREGLTDNGKLSTPRGTFDIYPGTWKQFKEDPQYKDWGMWFEHFLPEDADWKGVTEYYKIMSDGNHPIAVLFMKKEPGTQNGRITEDLDEKEQAIREVAEEAWRYNDKVDNFEEFKDIFSEDSFEITEEDYNKYITLIDEFKANMEANLPSEKEIQKFLKGLHGYADYNQKIDDLMDEFGMDKETAESYVWDDASGLYDLRNESLKENYSILDADTGDVFGNYTDINSAKRKANQYKQLGLGNNLVIVNPETNELIKLDGSLKEDTVKQGNHWVNKGKEGTHGKFKTKKAADAQRKAMFAQGYKEELNERFTNINGYYPDFCKTLDAHLNKIGFNVDVKNFASVIYIRVKKIEDTKKVTDYIKSLFDKYDIDPDITEDASEGSIMIDNLKQKTPMTVKSTTMQPNHNARTQTQDNRKTITVESLADYEFGDDEYDDYELSGIYGGDMTYCPICGARLVYREDGTHECPNCQEDAFTLAQERRKRDKEELYEGIFKKSQEDKILKNFKDMLAHLKDKVNTTQEMSDITDKELTKAAKKAVKKYGPPSQRTLDYLAQRAKERGFTEGLEDQEYDCVLCGEHFIGWGNNPWPVAEDGRCCDKCNMEKVLPARINLMKSHKNESFEDKKPAFEADDTKEWVSNFYTGGDEYIVFKTSDGMFTIIRENSDDDFDIIFQTDNFADIEKCKEKLYEDNVDFDLNL